jgi:hypothetical protein
MSQNQETSIGMIDDKSQKSQEMGDRTASDSHWTACETSLRRLDVEITGINRRTEQNTEQGPERRRRKRKIECATTHRTETALNLVQK